ncbi:MAG: extracellular solute-binding protein, partial [Phycisphaerae bacterium]
PEGYWYGFAARARVLIVNTRLVDDPAFPASIRDLADPRYAGKTGIAKPLFGTTATHVACLYAAWGPGPTTEYLDALKANRVQVHGGNKGAAEAVGDGVAAFALTDTDDAVEELAARKPVRIVYPDQSEGGSGTLFLPNVLAVVKGAPHADHAAALIDYLLSAEVEAQLAAGPSAQIPLGEGVNPDPRVKGPSQARPMAVDFAAAAAAFPAARTLVEKRLLNPGGG